MFSTNETPLKSAIPELCERLGISPNTARQLVKDGAIPTVRVGRQIKISEGQIEDFINRGGAGGWKRSGLSTTRAKPGREREWTSNQ